MWYEQAFRVLPGSTSIWLCPPRTIAAVLEIAFIADLTEKYMYW